MYIYFHKNKWNELNITEHLVLTLDIHILPYVQKSFYTKH